MLVLSRKLNETLRIGDNIKVTVLGIDGGTVKLGIDAPRVLAIVREELIKATESANREALSAPEVNFGAFGVHKITKIEKTDEVEKV